MGDVCCGFRLSGADVQLPSDLALPGRQGGGTAVGQVIGIPLVTESPCESALFRVRFFHRAQKHSVQRLGPPDACLTGPPLPRHGCRWACTGL